MHPIPINCGHRILHRQFRESSPDTVDPKDPTRRKDYAATKADLLHLITSPWGKYEIQRVYNNHIQTSTPTIAGAADTAKHTTKKYIGSIGQYRLTISPKSTGQHDTTEHKTRMQRLTKKLQELNTVEQTIDFREYTNRNQKQAFVIVHDSAATLQRVSNDSVLVSIGMTASPIYEITGRPLSPIMTQTVGAATNMISPKQTDSQTDVSRANTEVDHSSLPASITPELPVFDHLHFRPLSSEGLLNHGPRATACIVFPFSTISSDVMVY